MLGCNIGWTRRGVPFLEGNRSHDMMVPSWRDPDLSLRVAMALVITVGRGRMHFPATIPLLTRQL